MDAEVVEIVDMEDTEDGDEIDEVRVDAVDGLDAVDDLIAVDDAGKSAPLDDVVTARCLPLDARVIGGLAGGVMLSESFIVKRFIRSPTAEFVCQCCTIRYSNRCDSPSRPSCSLRFRTSTS